MTAERLPLAELLAEAGDGDFLRSVAEAVVQLLMETDVDGVIGAGRHERSGDRTTYRNGYRDRTLDTRLGSLQLRIPKLRQGSYFPPFLEPRRTSETAPPVEPLLVSAMSLRGSRFSPWSARWPPHHGVRGRGGTICQACWLR
jgi:Transposase, Mutator family